MMNLFHWSLITLAYVSKQKLYPIKYAHGFVAFCIGGIVLRVTGVRVTNLYSSGLFHWHTGNRNQTTNARQTTNRKHNFGDVL